MKKYLGIEFGSTRIKSVLIDEEANVIAQGAYEWENVLSRGLWSYPEEKILEGLAESYSSLARSYREKYCEELYEIDAIGISAMMHGYIALDRDDKLLVPFRTWRNTNAEEAADELTELLGFHIPTRWTVSQYYQAIKSGEDHIGEVAYVTTLSGYVHYLLTGERVLGIGDASGLFPIGGMDYSRPMLEKFNSLISGYGINTKFEDIIPRVLLAGARAGVLTEAGAKLIDKSGKLSAGIPFCPPEGDAGTGMVATNALMPKSSNVSAGTSAFLMAVLERDLDNYYKEIDIVTTPSGAPIAMVHANNFASEITAWTNLFAEVIELCGAKVERGALFDALYKKSLEADTDVGGLIGYSFLAAEPIAKVDRGVPLIARAAGGALTLSNLMKMHIYSALGTLSLGVKILMKEGVRIDSVYGHGGFFKTEFVGQSAMSAAIGAPVTVMKNAGEGGAWGIAVLALYSDGKGGSLEDFLAKIFAGAESTTVSAGEDEKARFDAFMEKFTRGLDLERYASKII